MEIVDIINDKVQNGDWVITSTNGVVTLNDNKYKIGIISMNKDTGVLYYSHYESFITSKILLDYLDKYGVR